MASAYFGECFKTKVVAFDAFYPVVPRKSAVPIHHEGNVPWDWALPQCPDQELSKLIDRPFCRWRCQQPLSQPRGHFYICLGRKGCRQQVLVPNGGKGSDLYSTESEVVGYTKGSGSV